LARISV